MPLLMQCCRGDGASMILILALSIYDTRLELYLKEKETTFPSVGLPVSFFLCCLLLLLPYFHFWLCGGRDMMRMIGRWNDFAMERDTSRKEVCEHILANDDCFQVLISYLEKYHLFFLLLSLSFARDFAVSAAELFLKCIMFLACVSYGSRKTVFLLRISLYVFLFPFALLPGIYCAAIDAAFISQRVTPHPFLRSFFTNRKSTNQCSTLTSLQHILLENSHT